MDTTVTQRLDLFPLWDELSPERQGIWDAIIAAVPTPPPLLTELSSSNLSLDNFDPRALAEKVSVDPVLGGRLLAEVNSARYGLSSPITSVHRACVHMGFNLVRSIVVNYLIENAFGKGLPIKHAHLSLMRRWSAGMSVLAKHWAQTAELQDHSTASTLALLARVGALLLALGDPPLGQDYYTQPTEIARLYLELNRWGVYTPLLSARMISRWEVPEPVPAKLARLWEPYFNELPAGEDNRMITLVAACSPLIERYLYNEQADVVSILERPDYEQLRQNLEDFALLEPLKAVWITARLHRDLGAVTN